MIEPTILEYIHKALSSSNRKKWDGDSNAPYKVVITFCECGQYGDDPGGFWFQLKIPRQVDNSLAMSMTQEVEYDRNKAAAILRQLADELEKPCAQA